MTRRAMQTTILAALGALLSVGFAMAGTTVTEIGARDGVSIFLSDVGKTLIEERRDVPLQQGMNTVSASFASDRIDRSGLLLSCADPDAGLEISGAIFPRATGKLVQWEVTSPRDQLVTLRAIYPISYVSCTPQYEILFPIGGPDVGEGLPAPVEGLGSQRAEFSAQVLVGNGTGRDLPLAGLYVAGSRIDERAIAAGEAVKLCYQRVADLPLDTSLVFDATRYGASIALQGTIVNSPEVGLGAGPLPAGRVRTYASDGRDSPTLAAEDTLESLAVGEKCEVFLGFQQDIRAKRDAAPGTQVNVRRDLRGRSVAFDLEEKVSFQFASPRLEPVSLRVIEHIEGQWQIVRSSHRYAKLDATTIEFLVPVPPGDRETQPTTLEYVVRRKNLAP